MGLSDYGFVLAVALLTWGGVFLYLVRLERLTRALENEVRRRDEREETERRDAVPEMSAGYEVSDDAR